MDRTHFKKGEDKSTFKNALKKDRTHVKPLEKIRVPLKRPLKKYVHTYIPMESHLAAFATVMQHV